jgi:NDP-sugar pyrophosphorylase family protein
MKAIILAGGKGRRLAPFTETIPKPLFPVGEKTILEIIVNQLLKADVKRMTFAVGYLAELIQAYFGDGRKFGVSIDYARESKPLGTAGPLYLLKNRKENFLVMNGDVLTTMNFKDLFRFHEKSKAIATICCYKKKVKSSLGVVEVDEKDHLKNYKEKPVFNHLVSTGIYCFNPRVAKYLKKSEHIDLPDLMLRLISAGEKVRVYHVKGEWFDIGTPDDYARAVDFWGKKEK